jgi:hypothetical protein
MGHRRRQTGDSQARERNTYPWTHP